MFTFSLFSSYIPYLIIAIVYSLYLITFSVEKYLGKEKQVYENYADIRTDVKTNIIYLEIVTGFEEYVAELSTSEYPEIPPCVFACKLLISKVYLHIEQLNRFIIPLLPNPPPVF